MYGDVAVSDGTHQKWVAKFRSGDYSRAVAPRVRQTRCSGEPTTAGVSWVRAHHGTWDTGDILKESRSGFENHSRQFGYVHCFDVWVPQKLSRLVGDCY